jgi:hypothetical protein
MRCLALLQSRATSSEGRVVVGHCQPTEPGRRRTVLKDPRQEMLTFPWPLLELGTGLTETARVEESVTTKAPIENG